MDIVTLATYSSTVQAELAKVYLESEGINCFVTDSTTNNLKILGGAPPGVRLQVYADSLERAQETLTRFETQNPSEFDEEALMRAFEQDAAERLEQQVEHTEHVHDAIEEFISQQEITTERHSEAEPTCPRCGSWRLVRERNLGFLLYLLTVLLVGLPLLFIKPNLRCQKCGYRADQ